jgi:hypothetical protein
VNGKPTSGKDLIVRMSENGQFEKEQKVTTNDNGLATSIFQTSQGINKISFSVSYVRVICDMQASLPQIPFQNSI